MSRLKSTVARGTTAFSSAKDRGRDESRQGSEQKPKGGGSAWRGSRRFDESAHLRTASGLSCAVEARYARISLITRAGSTPVSRWSSPWNL